VQTRRRASAETRACIKESPLWFSSEVNPFEWHGRFALKTRSGRTTAAGPRWANKRHRQLLDYFVGKRRYRGWDFER
jgi:hypothetical protein